MRTLLGGVAAAALLLGGCGATATETTASTATTVETPAAGRTSTVTSAARTTQPRTPAQTTGRATTSAMSRLRACALDDLPREAGETARAIAAGGPFAHPRNDGVVFQNREQILPKRARGVYREFTVDTPGASTRGTRRIITDANPTTGAPTRTPSAWYYTGDHYASFCAVTGTP